jgi:hypothetical protein
VSFIPFDRDLSAYSEDELRAALRVLRRGWKKPWLWLEIAPAYIAISYELEWRQALRQES